MEEIALEQFHKAQYKGIGQKRRLNILKNEVFIGNIISNYKDKNNKEKNKSKRASLYDFIGGQKKKKNKSNSVDLTKSALQSLKGTSYNMKSNMQEYIIENPVTKGRSLSSAKKERKNNFLISTKNEIENENLSPIQLIKTQKHSSLSCPRKQNTNNQKTIKPYKSKFIFQKDEWCYEPTKLKKSNLKGNIKDINKIHKNITYEYLNKALVNKFNSFIKVCLNDSLIDNKMNPLLKNPKISVIIPIFNGGKYLYYSLRSIQNK